MKKKLTLPKLKKKLDCIFSEYIRRRDSDGEYGCCITCGKPINWKYEGNAGHFQDRAKLSTRFHEQNVHLQCVSCNKYHGGRQYIYGHIIDDLYGEGTADMLEAMPKDGFKISRAEYAVLIAQYKQKVEELT